MVDIELELAIKLIDNSVQEIEDIEEIRIEDARNRLAGADIYAPISQPPFDRSPLDGYALRSKDTNGASKNNPIKLKVIDEIFAGAFTDKEVKEKEAIRIMTGAKIPTGADCIIRQENTNYGMETVEIYEQLGEYDNYCFKGEDIQKGSKLISKGEKLNYIHIGILSSMGYKTVVVKRRPNIAIISTGDEIVEGGQPLEEGKIYDSNRRIVEARSLDYGCNIIYSKIIGDDINRVSEEIENVIDKVDIVITTGGVSVGKKDIMHEVIEKLNANRIFWRIKMKPGTPALYSIYKNKPIISLSGNPFALLATFEIIGKFLIYKLSGDKELKQKRKKAIMEDNFMKESKGRRIIRAIYEDNKIYMPKGGHSSGVMKSMIGCNCFIDIKAGTKQILKGDEVEIILIEGI